MSDGRTTIVDSGVRNVQKAYTVEREEERRAGLMATKSWRLVKKILMLTFRMTTAIWNVTRVQSKIRTETGMRLAVLDSAATNVWFDEETFAKCNGRDLESATRGAGGADGSALDVVGTW
jgi:hypothetical protein